MFIHTMYYIYYDKEVPQFLAPMKVFIKQRGHTHEVSSLRRIEVSNILILQRYIIDMQDASI